MWFLYFLGLAAVAAVFWMAARGWLGPMPDFEDLENPKTALATEIISADGQTLGKFFRQNRTPVSYDELPPHLVHALVSTEDERFYDHPGIDAKSTVRAVAFLGKRGGGSTITQQLAKLLFHKEGSKNILERIKQKIKEMVISVRLERQYTKDEIITMYMNTYDWGHQAVGIRSAARIYFGKEPRELDIDEAATLVGMLKNSSLYNPLKRPELVKKRRNVVFHQMYRNGYLTEAQKDSLQQLPLRINFTPEMHDTGIATYFRERVRRFMKKWVREHPKPDGSYYNIYTDGLKIYTSIDSRMQRNAEKAVEEHMKNLQKEFFRQGKNNKTFPFVGLSQKQIAQLMDRAMRQSDRWRVMEKAGIPEDSIRKSFETPQKMRIFSWDGEIDTVMTPYDSIRYYKSFLRAGLMSMEPSTGFVKAWVGGINFKHFKYDHVDQGARQVGSTFKPFVYATAIAQKHLSPCDSFPNTPYTIKKGRWGLTKSWTPKNAGGQYGGWLTLKEALANSVNVITARLIDMVGPKPVIDMVKKMGIKSEIPYAPSIALGTPDIKLYEMVGAFNTFANQGQYIEPVYILRIEDKNGKVLYEYKPVTRDVLSPQIAYVVTNLLEGVTQYGSGARLRHTYMKNSPVYKRAVTGYPYAFKNPIAGKTGTTQNQSDGWFIGYVPNLVTGVWVGGEDRAVHFRSIAYGQGATMALPIWALYMKKNYADKELGVSDKPFKRPPGVDINLDCEKPSDSPTGQPEDSPLEDL
ncbi:MAG: PBP1A family penicillin-binding protein [Chlorobi bacterium]|nr:PBP1A family penicillin-binding protein [Chlorobiota bacterium]